MSNMEMCREVLRLDDVPVHYDPRVCLLARGHVGLHVCGGLAWGTPEEVAEQRQAAQDARDRLLCEILADELPQWVREVKLALTQARLDLAAIPHARDAWSKSQHVSGFAVAIAAAARALGCDEGE